MEKRVVENMKLASCAPWPWSAALTHHMLHYVAGACIDGLWMSLMSCPEALPSPSCRKFRATPSGTGAESGEGIACEALKASKASLIWSQRGVTRHAVDCLVPPAHSHMSHMSLPHCIWFVWFVFLPSSPIFPNCVTMTVTFVIEVR